MEFIKMALVISSTLLTLFAAKYYIHMLQLEGYFISQYFRHLFARIRKPKLLFGKVQAKKPLVYTARIKRLFVALGIITFVYNFLFGYLFIDELSQELSFPAGVFCFIHDLRFYLWIGLTQ